MTPNVADFTISTNVYERICVNCPDCGWEESRDWIPEIREIISVASEHARTAHPMSAPAAIQGT